MKAFRRGGEGLYVAMGAIVVADDLLLELSFVNLEYAKAMEAYEEATDCVRREVEAIGFQSCRWEAYFSRYRLILYFATKHGGQREKAVELCSNILAHLAGIIAPAQVQGLIQFYGDCPLPGNIHGVEAEKHTWVGSQKVTVDGCEHYWRQLKRCNIIVDNGRRERAIRQLLAEGADRVGGQIVGSANLLNQMVLENERPTMRLVEFAPRYLSLPEQLLLTVLEEAAIFAIEDNQGNLLPWAVAIGEKGGDLAASLAEVKKLYQADLARPLAEYEKLLSATDYLPELGSYRDKTARLQKLVLTMAEQLDAGEIVLEVARKATMLCKIDQNCHVCARYPSLRGMMAALLAQRAGEDDRVVTALGEHVLPRGKLPRTLVGALLAVADQLDELCGQYHCEAGGYCLRQLPPLLAQTVEILDRADLDLSLVRMLRFAFAQYQSQGLATWRQRDLGLLKQMFWHSLADYLLAQGYGEKVVRALLAVEPDNVFTVVRRAEVLIEEEQAGEVALCSEVCKMLDKCCPRDYNYGEVGREYLEQPEEKELFEVMLVLKDEVLTDLDKRRYARALSRLAKIHSVVLRYANAVDLDCGDSMLRANRLALLAELRRLFHRFADCGQL